MDQRHEQARQMRERGMTQADIGACLGVSQATVSRMLREPRPSGRDRWARIAADVAAGREPAEWEAA